MNTSTFVALIVIVLLLIPAVRATVKRMKGETSCCGSPKEPRPSKKIQGKPQEVLLLQIEGMQCVNCRNRIEKYLDEMEGVTARVNLEQKTAEVRLYKNIDSELICNTISGLGYTVVGMQIL